ncbi:MAG: orotidine-5'-phosphate decarboxylase [Candidatus Aenigmarchaeota archaeon]|nr:orotidine-5'-phosphate decarboxylase [Candidatus Aenigmarchaeota archaeon]
MGYAERSSIARNKAARRLFRLMEGKQTSLALAADLVSGREVAKIAGKIGNDICVLKTHCDAVSRFGQITGELKDLGKDLGFMILEDRKFADIGEISRRQLRFINSWADFVTAHAIAGKGTIEALGKNVVIVAEMTQSGSLTNAGYRKRAIQIGESLDSTGFVLNPANKTHVNQKFVVFSPGINFSSRGDSYGQTYVSPVTAIKNGTDVIIVGRGIYAAKNPAKKSKEYRKISWSALEKLRF